MPDSLIDLGGGFKVLNPEKLIPDTKQTNPIESATSILGLVNTVGEIQQRNLKAEQDAQDRPLLQQKLQADVDYAQNKVKMIPKENEKLLTEIYNSKQEELRKSITFFGDAMEKGLKLGQSNPELGLGYIMRVLPKGSVPVPVQDKKGVYQVMIPDGNRGYKEFLYDPTKISDPNNRLQGEANMRKEFESTPEVSQFNILHGAYKTAVGSLKNPTQAKDLALKYSILKALDPSSNVMPGEMATADNTTGISQYTLNQINRLMGGPTLGEEKSNVRKELFDVIKEKYETKKKTVIELGRNNWRIAEGAGLTPDATLRPIGDLKINDFIPVDRLANMPIEKLSKQQKLDLYNYQTQQGNN